MITDSMTWFEVKEHLIKERNDILPRILSWLDKNERKFRRAAIKTSFSRKDTLLEFNEFVIKSKNNMLFYIKPYSYGKKDILMGEILFAIVTLFEFNGGKYVAAIGVGKEIYVFTQHFVSRYSERIRNLNANDFIHNIQSVWIRNSINTIFKDKYSYSKHGSNSISISAKEGVWLGNLVGDMFLIKTCVSTNMLKKQQTEQHQIGLSNLIHFIKSNYSENFYDYYKRCMSV